MYLRKNMEFHQVNIEINKGNMKKNKTLSIGNSIFVYFTVTAIVAAIFISLGIYTRLSSELSKSIKEENFNLVNQINTSIDRHIKECIRLSDTIYYSIIKNNDISDKIIGENINLLYDNNKNNIENISIFSTEGDLLLCVPAARLKQNYKITNEVWFGKTLTNNESIYFSPASVQYKFIQNDNVYKWVISMARAIEINRAGKIEQAMLLIDIDYFSIIQLLDNINFGKNSYIYLVDAFGELIYHPKLQLIYAGIEKENNLKEAAYPDGIYVDKFNNIHRNIIVKTVGYTGWKIIGVNLQKAPGLNGFKIKLFIIFIIACIIFMVSIINAYISYIVTDPIKMLEKSVNEIENGNIDANIYIGGSYEIRHLGASIKNMTRKIKALMNTIVREHEEKRKSEFDTLQSQINPHFLYNTLDIIVWMIENENKSDAVKIVTSLARFFRISLSKGKNIISVKNEIEHVKNYLMIQQMRFKNKFKYEIDVDENVLNYISLKLILQPLAENSIYHGMEFMDGDGLIKIEAKEVSGDLYFKIIDNGLGMTNKQIEEILNGKVKSNSKKGSGIGINNVNQRIKLYFGSDYGLSIESEPDIGTTIILKLPIRSIEEYE